MPSIFVNMASTVPGTITVKNWSSGQLGISLQNEVSDETLKGFGGNDALNAGLGDDASQKNSSFNSCLCMPYKGYSPI